MFNQKSVQFKFNGRYFVSGELDQHTKSVFMVFHGQGQLAEHFIKKFDALKNKELCIIAPEGLHHYYLDGYNGRVGASWMTSENRLISIKNYLQFLDSVLADVLALTSTEIHLNLLGFSQGTATVSRWVAHGNFQFEQLILWGGALPPDLDKKAIKTRMKDKPLTYVIGDSDQYINSKRIEEMKELVDKYGLEANFLHYEGGHDIDEGVLMEIFS